MGAAPPSDQLGALVAAAPPLLHVYPAPAQSFPDLKSDVLDPTPNANPNAHLSKQRKGSSIFFEFLSHERS